MKFTGICGTNVLQSYGFVGENTPEPSIVYCIIRNIIEAPRLHSFTIESAKIHRFKTFRAGNFASKASVLSPFSLPYTFVKIFQ